MRKRYVKTFVVAVAVMTTGLANAQCPTITCPASINVNNDAGNCGAVVSYTAPAGTDPCSSSSTTFNYTGSIVNWTVPAGVTSINIEARGAQGGWNTNSTVLPGMGAVMIGDFAVTPGAQLKILVGQQPSNGSGNGGGGGTFVTDMSNNPLIVAGGGGGSAQTTDSPDKHGQVGTAGGTGAAGGGAGGTAGSGGSIGASGFQSGAGGGLLTNGADGWIAGTGGFAFVNGGAGGGNNSSANGGFGGGGTGSSYVVGGGGGGYSGGGSGGNSSAGVGGGGGSYNGGANQNNTGGANTGHGMVVIAYGASSTLTTTMLSGLGSGATFPVGTTTETYVVTDGLGNSDTCSFTVTVVDNDAPSVSCPANVSTCDPLVQNIAPSSIADNCTAPVAVSYNMTGATTGSGASDASGTTFNAGTTTVWYIATDAAGNADSCSFTVTVNPSPVVGAAASSTNVCVDDGAVTLAGTPVNGTWTGAGVTGSSFDPAAAGAGSHTLTYTFTDSNGCMDSATVTIVVDVCVGISEGSALTGLDIYPNPASNNVTIDLGAAYASAEVSVAEITGKVVKAEKYNNTNKIVTDISDLAKGVYFLTVKASDKISIVKIVKN